MSESKRGGRRPGAGRPKGSLGKATMLRNAMALGSPGATIEPLALMLEAMRDAYANGDMKTAFAYAEKCAPFCHARLQSVTSKVTVRRAEQMTTEELEAELVEMGVDVAAALAVDGNETKH